MKDVIIAISREYGSGGREIGRLLAEELSVPLFDKEIVHMAIERSGLDESFIQKHGESVPSKLLLNFHRLSLNVPNIRVPSGFNSHHVAAYAKPNGGIKTNEDQLFDTKSAIIKELAGKGGCVIVGRCASWVLQNNPNLLSIFIQGELEDRVRRSIYTYGNSDKGATEDVKQIDKHRANYYKMHTGQKWGVAQNYDLVINSSYTGVHGAVNVIKAMVENKRSVYER